MDFSDEMKKDLNHYKCTISQVSSTIKKCWDKRNKMEKEPQKARVVTSFLPYSPTMSAPKHIVLCVISPKNQNSGVHEDKIVLGASISKHTTERSHTSRLSLTIRMCSGIFLYWVPVTANWQIYMYHCRGHFLNALITVTLSASKDQIYPSALNLAVRRPVREQHSLLDPHF